MTKVFVQGAYDILSVGHIRTLNQARSYGDWLIVGLNSDELMRIYKREPIIPWDQRAAILTGLRVVDQVVPALSSDPIGLLMEWNIDVYCIGSEYLDKESEARRYCREFGLPVYVLPRHEDIMCSSDIRKEVEDRALARWAGAVEGC